MGRNQTHKGVYTPKNPSKYRGDFRKIIYRSSWEKKFFIFLDTSPSVLFWSSEEIIVPYISPLDNKVHRYFPDVVCKMKTTSGIETYMIEVKPYCQTILPESRKGKRKKTLDEELITFAINDAKWKAARAYCDKYKWKFKIITERELY